VSAACYPAKIKRAMIFVLGHQVKPKVAGIYVKSVEKSTENNRNQPYETNPAAS
jgi:hypothetical protein